MLQFRKTTDVDWERISAWIAADPDHKDRCTAEFWLPGTSAAEPQAECFAVEDEVGTIFYVRAENLLRLHIQFAPDEHRRTAKAIAEFTERIAHHGRAKRYAQLIFESVSKPLIRFLEKRGFRSSPNEQVRDL